MVSAFIAAALAQDEAEAAKLQWLRVADQLRPKVPKLAAPMDAAEPDVLADTRFPAQHRVKLHSTNPLERLNGEIKRRTEVVGIFPDEAAITRLVGAILLEQNDERAVQRTRSITLESIVPIGDDPLVSLPTLSSLIKPRALPVIAMASPSYTAPADATQRMAVPQRKVERAAPVTLPHRMETPHVLIVPRTVCPSGRHGEAFHKLTGAQTEYLVGYAGPGRNHLSCCDP